MGFTILVTELGILNLILNIDTNVKVLVVLRQFSFHVQTLSSYLNLEREYCPTLLVFMLAGASQTCRLPLKLVLTTCIKIGTIGKKRLL